MRQLKGSTRKLIVAGVVLAAMGAGVGVVLVRRYDLTEASSIVTVIGLPLALVGLLLTFLGAAISAANSGAAPSTTIEIVDQLAIAVQGQWESEGDIRRLQDPHFLSVSWEPAAKELVNDWSQVTRLAESWPRNLTSNPSGWAESSRGIAGRDGQLADYLMSRVPTARLVVLGEAGAGKSVLLIRTLLEILASRNSGGPVPILITMDSWDPEQDDFLEWVEAQLSRDYPGLREPAPGILSAHTRAAALLTERQLILLLDGFDEISPSSRGLAIGKINSALRPGQAIMISSRTREYHEATNAPIGKGILLSGSAGVSLTDLDPTAIAEYLTLDAGSPVSAARWTTVIAELKRDSPVASALRTPLMVGLARTVYNPRPGESPGSIPDPAELCNRKRFSEASQIVDHLFDAFIPAIYRRGSRWRPDQAERWLTFLASQLSDPMSPSLGIRWWELRNTAPKYSASLVPGVATGSVAGVVAGLGGRHLGLGIGIGLLTGIIISYMTQRLLNAPRRLAEGFAGGVVGGLLGGLLGGIANRFIPGASHSSTIGLIGGIEIGLAVAPIGGRIGALFGGFGGGIADAIFAGRASGVIAGLVDGMAVAFVVALTIEVCGRRTPSKGLRGLRWSPIAAIAGLGVGLAVGLTLGLGVKLGVTTGLITGTISGLTTGMVAGLGGAPADLTEAPSPLITFQRDRSIFWITSCATALALGLTAGLGIGPPVGIAAGFGYGLTVGFLQSATGAFGVTRLWLAATRRMPLRVMSFMVEAHKKRGVLRQVGAVYQFKHPDLQRRLTSRQ